MRLCGGCLAPLSSCGVAVARMQSVHEGSSDARLAKCGSIVIRWVLIKTQEDVAETKCAAQKVATQCDDGEGQVQKHRKSVTRWDREHSTGAGLGVEGGKVSEPPRTLAIDFSL